jgi:hypothetical protein
LAFAERGQLEGLLRETKMPVHDASGRTRNTQHESGKRNLDYVRRKSPVRKVAVSAVPAVFHADAVSEGKNVWAGFDGESVVCVAATADECRGLYIAWERRQPRAVGGSTPPVKAAKMLTTN